MLESPSSETGGTMIPTAKNRICFGLGFLLTTLTCSGLPDQAHAATNNPPARNLRQWVCDETGYLCYPKASLDLTFGVIPAQEGGQKSQESGTCDDYPADDPEHYHSCPRQQKELTPEEQKTIDDVEKQVVLGSSDWGRPEKEEHCNDNNHISSFKKMLSTARLTNIFTKQPGNRGSEAWGFLNIEFPMVSDETRFQAYVRYFMPRRESNKIEQHSTDYLITARTDKGAIGCQLLIPLPINRYGDPDYMEEGDYTVEVDLINGLNGFIRKDIIVNGHQGQQ